MKPKIVVIGSSNVDMIMKMERLPKEGETITDAEYMQTFGGKGANQAVGAARAGGNVTFVNCVGDDLFVETMIKNFEEDGMDTRYIFHETGISSGTALVMIGEGGRNYLSVSPGANYRLSPAYIDKVKSVIDEAKIVVLQYEILPKTLKYILDYCDEKNKNVLWNFAPARTFDIDYLKKVNILVVNETEAEILSGITVNNYENAKAAIHKLMELGTQTVILTLGENGSLIGKPENIEKVEAFAVEAVDTTAAGDVYCGSLAVALVEGKSLKQAVRFASGAAALSVTKLGAQPSAPYRKEIDDFIS